MHHAHLYKTGDQATLTLKSNFNSMTDTTASILEAIVSQAKSDSVSPTPNTPLFSGEKQPIFPMLRCSHSIHAEGPAKPGAVVRFRLPNAIDSGVHIIEQVWLEFSISPGLTSFDSTDLAGLLAIGRLELRSSENVLIEAMTGEDIHIHSRVTLSQSMLALATSLASTSFSGSVQIPLPLCILKDNSWFPYLALKNGLEIRLQHSMLDLPTIVRSSAKIWISGYAIPTSSFPLYQNKTYVFPITTLHSQTKVFEKGSIATEETFLLEDPRDLQELLFVIKPDPPDPLLPFEIMGPNTQVYDALKDTWIEVGTDRITDPLRHQIVRSIAFLQKHARVPALEEGIHCIPLSNIPEPILYGFSTPGLMSHIQPKISLKLRFNSINRDPGDRVRFRIYALMVRGQRLRIQNGKVRTLDESYTNYDAMKSEDLPDPDSEINPDDPGSMATNDLHRPKSTIGFLPRYRELTHEPFSRITRTHALRGSHAFNDLIVAKVPLETDFLANITLRTRLPALPSGYKWINGVGYRLLKRVIVRHEDIILFDAPGEALFMLDQQDTDLVDRSKINAIDYGYRSPNSIDISDVSMGIYRENGSVDGYLRINVPWSFSQNDFTPLPTAALRDRSLEVEFRLAELDNVIVSTDDSTLSISQREELGRLRLSETLLDIEGYVLPHSEREKIMGEPKVIRCLQYNLQHFPDTDGILRVIPIKSGLKRLLMTSPGDIVNGSGVYNPIQIVQLYAGSTKWYQQQPPPEFFEEWSRWRQGNGEPDIPILCIDNRPGFINCARLDELRIETTPGRLNVLTETEQFYRIQKGKIGPLYAD